MKLRSLAATAGALVFATAARAQAPDDWQMRGTVGPYPIGMDLIVNGHDHVASGFYFYTRELKDIPLTQMTGDAPIVLRELDGTSFHLHFVGNGSEHGSPLSFNNSVAMAGTWTRGAKTLPVKIDFDGMSGNDQPGHRYAMITKEDDATFEAKARGFLRGVVTGDKDEAASAVSFPLGVNGPGKQHRIIKDRAALMAQWRTIFTPAFVAQLRTAVPHDMFVRDIGAMVVHGAVWFNDKGAYQLNLDISR